MITLRLTQESTDSSALLKKSRRDFFRSRYGLTLRLEKNRRIFARSSFTACLGIADSRFHFFQRINYFCSPKEPLSQNFEWNAKLMPKGVSEAQTGIDDGEANVSEGESKIVLRCYHD